MPSFPAFTQPTYPRRAVVIVCLALVYVAAALVGFRHAIVAEQVTLVWPPSGIALGAVLLLGRWVWPGILLGAFMANLTTEMLAPAAAAIAAGNTLEALVAERLLARAEFRGALARLRDALALVLLAALASTVVSATIGSFALVLSGVRPPAALHTLWRDWWLGDAVGDLTVAPVLLTWFGGRAPRLAARHIAELVLLAAALVGACLLAFACPADSPANAYPVHYLVVPFIAWGALRFGPRGSAATVLVAATVAVASTTSGLGPFSRRADEALLLLQLFVAVVAVTGLLLGAAIGERNAKHDVLSLTIDVRTSSSPHSRTSSATPSRRSQEPSSSWEPNAPIRRASNAYVGCSIDRPPTCPGWSTICWTCLASLPARFSCAPSASTSAKSFRAPST